MRGRSRLVVAALALAASAILPAQALAADAAAPGAVASARARELFPPGLYRLEIRMASRVELPRLGELAGATMSVSEARVEHGAEGVRQRHHVCRLWDASAASWGGLVFPEEFVAALDAPRYEVVLEPSADGGLGYRADLGVERIGFASGAAPEAARPSGVPTRPEDPRVRDWDGDGRPGATLRLRLPVLPDAELWIVQRGRALLDGEVVAPGRVEGSVRVVEFAQEVIGARPAFLRRTPRQSPDPDGSRFVLHRVVRPEEAPVCDGAPGPPAALGPEAAS